MLADKITSEEHSDLVPKVPLMEFDLTMFN